MHQAGTINARVPTLGTGVYSLAEVARYTELHPSRVRAWFHGRSDGGGRGPLFHSDYRRILGEYTVSFYDMIDALVAGQFRSCGVKMKVVRRAYDFLSKTLNTRHSFCHCDLFTDGRTIIVRAADALGDETLREAISHQTLFPQIQAYLKHIEYSEVSRLAVRWRIAKGVVVDPQVSRGRPVIEGTGIGTFVLAQTYLANQKNVDLVADLYDISPVAVTDAVQFENSVSRRHAA